MSLLPISANVALMCIIPSPKPVTSHRVHPISGPTPNLSPLIRPVLFPTDVPLAYQTQHVENLITAASCQTVPSQMTCFSSWPSPSPVASVMPASSSYCPFSPSVHCWAISGPPSTSAGWAAAGLWFCVGCWRFWDGGWSLLLESNQIERGWKKNCTCHVLWKWQSSQEPKGGAPPALFSRKNLSKAWSVSFVERVGRECDQNCKTFCIWHSGWALLSLSPSLTPQSSLSPIPTELTSVTCLA